MIQFEVPLVTMNTFSWPYTKLYTVNTLNIERDNLDKSLLCFEFDAFAKIAVVGNNVSSQSNMTVVLLFITPC